MSLRIILSTIPLLSRLLPDAHVPRAGGLIENQLRPCPPRPNCVISEKGAAGAISPISFPTSEEEAWQEIQTVIETLGGKILKREPTYLWASFTSSFFGFVDDVELRLESGEHFMHIRSGARTGYFDFRVNRKRVEKIRKLFNERIVGKKMGS